MPYNKNKIVNLLMFLIIAFALLFFYLQVKVVFRSNSFNPKPSDAIVILGHAMVDTYTPSPWLESRLQEGLYLYFNNYADKIIVSGGVGPTDNVPVAYGMKNWLVSRGVPIEYILVEDSSNNTYENFKYSKEVAYINNITSIIVVTNDFHMYRSIYISSKFFEYVSGSSAYTTFNFSKLLAYIKEPLSIIKYTVVHIFNS